jgi:hypothetical protein
MVAAANTEAMERELMAAPLGEVPPAVTEGVEAAPAAVAEATRTVLTPEVFGADTPEDEDADGVTNELDEEMGVAPDAEDTDDDAVPLEAGPEADPDDPSTCPAGAVDGGGVPWVASRSWPVPQGIGLPSGWFAFGGGVVAPVASEMAKRPVQVAFWSCAVNW